jgi:hypothetical protein
MICLNIDKIIQEYMGISIYDLEEYCKLISQKLITCHFDWKKITSYYILPVITQCRWNSDEFWTKYSRNHDFTLCHEHYPKDWYWKKITS